MGTLYYNYISIFISIGIFIHLQCITKTLTLPTLGLPPMCVCCSSSQLSLPLCTFSCMRTRCFSFQLLLRFLHAFFPHSHPSFHFGLLPTPLYFFQGKQHLPSPILGNLGWFFMITCMQKIIAYIISTVRDLASLITFSI